MKRKKIPLVVDAISPTSRKKLPLLVLTVKELSVCPSVSGGFVSILSSFSAML